MERERDRARSTKFFDPKFNFNEPPPKVRTPPNTSALHLKNTFFVSAAFEDEAGPFREHAQHRSAHTGERRATKWHFPFPLGVTCVCICS